MKVLAKHPSLTMGFALFSMFFGAGNVIFPLMVGQVSGHLTLFSSLALCFTAVMMPIVGVIAMLKFDCNTSRFFARLGPIPGQALLMLSMALIGPLVGIPRTITVAYDSFAIYGHLVPQAVFSFVFISIMACCLIKRVGLVNLIGQYLTPALLCLLMGLIMTGLSSGGLSHSQHDSVATALFYGIQQGYNTLDLVAALFFASVIMQHLKSHSHLTNNPKQSIRYCIIAALIAGLLLACVYIGLALASAMHSQEIPGEIQGGILVALSQVIIGDYAAFFASTIVLLACFTTAITLVDISAHYLKNTLRNKLYFSQYNFCLFVVLILSFLLSLLGFSGIMNLVAPLILLCYPIYILLSLSNLAPLAISNGTLQLLSLLTLTIAIVMNFIA